MGLVHVGVKDIIVPAGVLGRGPLVTGRGWRRDPTRGSSIVGIFEVQRPLLGGET